MASDLAVTTTSSRLLKITSLLALLLMTAVVLKTMSFLFVPLSVALLCCYALGLPMDLLQRLRVPAGLRILLVILCAALVFYLLGRLLHANLIEPAGAVAGVRGDFLGLRRKRALPVAD